MNDLMVLFKKARGVQKSEGTIGLVSKVIRKVSSGNVKISNHPGGGHNWKDERPFYDKLEERSDIRPDKEIITKFKNKYKGERCFIVGNGPSLNKLDLTKLENEKSFAVNGIFYKTKEMGYLPTFYVVEDSHVMKDNVKEINEYYPQEFRFFPTEYKKYLKNSKNTAFFNMNRGFYEKKSPKFRIPQFSLDCAERIFCGQSVTIINLQLAYYMGFSEVYLLGMDFTYTIPPSAQVEGCNILSTEDDPNHFHPDYFGKGKSWHDPQLDQVKKNYQMCKLIYEFDNRKIFNATCGGNLDVFERVNFESLF